MAIIQIQWQLRNKPIRVAHERILRSQGGMDDDAIVFRSGGASVGSRCGFTHAPRATERTKKRGGEHYCDIGHIVARTGRRRANLFSTKQMGRSDSTRRAAEARVATVPGDAEGDTNFRVVRW